MDEFEEIYRQVKKSFDAAVTSNSPPEVAAVAALREALPQLSIQEGAKVQLPAVHREYVQDNMRSVLADIVQAAVENKQSVMEYRLPSSEEPAVPRLLNMALHLCDQMTIHPGFMFVLLEDVVDTSPTCDIEEVFTYLQGITPQLKKKHIYEHSKTAVLRTCNTLKRRLSKSRDYQLCGKVLVFLAKLYPLSERSGVNMMGATNLSHSISVEEVEAALDSNGEPIDPTFYQKFWGLQNTFQNPTSAVSVAGWSRFVSDVSLVLDVFASKTVKCGGGPLADLHSSTTPKYLSSSRLMSLQLQDSTFRRYFLVQVAILLHTLQTPGRNQKEVLKKGQLEQLETLQTKVFQAMEKSAAAQHIQVFQAMEETPEDGAQFSAAVKQVLQYETHWVEWKYPTEKDKTGKDKMACAAWERPPVTLEPPLKRTRIARNQDLEQALSQTNNMQGLAIDNRDKYQTWKDVLRMVIGDMDPDERVAESEKVKNNKEWVWRATRLVARQNLEVFFHPTNYEINLEDVARKLLPEEVAEIDKKIKAKQESKPAADKSRSDGQLEAGAQAGAEGGDIGAFEGDGLSGAVGGDDSVAGTPLAGVEENGNGVPQTPPNGTDNVMDTQP